MSLLPSESVRIQPAASASGTVRETTDNGWVALGFALPGLLTEVWGMYESRMDIHPTVDTETRYDVVLIPPVPEPRAAMVERIRRAIAHQLQLIIKTEARSLEILVLTAPANPVAYSPVYASESGGWMWNSDWTPAPADMPHTPEAIGEWLKSQMRRIPAIGMAFPQNPILPFSGGILMVGDPEEDGSCPIQIECMGPRTEDQLLRALREDLGITASKERRSVEILVVRPRLQ
jgi:hypothetical protein